MWNTDRALVTAVWADSEYIDDAVYALLMASANASCVAFAPVLPEGEEIPAHWKLAEIAQAKDVWGQMSAGNREETGPDGYSIPVTRLCYVARDILRPKTPPLLRLR